jgi:WD40 repeat protein
MCRTKYSRGSTCQRSSRASPSRPTAYGQLEVVQQDISIFGRSVLPFFLGRQTQRLSVTMFDMKNVKRLQIASGLLLSSFDAHYRSILTLFFSPTSQLLVSSSEDSSTFVWSVTRLVDNDPRLMNALPEPWGALEGHSLAVVCVGVGKGGGPAGVEGRVWTGSMDGTIKVRDIAQIGAIQAWLTDYRCNVVDRSGPWILQRS